MKASNQTAISALAAANRAWIAPSQMGLNRPLEEAGPLTVILLAENTGREPAIDVVYAFNAFLIPYIREGSEPVSMPDHNNTCSGLHPEPTGGTVIYPGKTNVQIVHGFEDNPANRTLVGNVLARTASLIVEGCIAYRTYGSVHTSKFRFFLRDVEGAPSCGRIAPDEINCRWRFNVTDLGNEAG
jgi:hypothetical protein